MTDTAAWPPSMGVDGAYIRFAAMLSARFFSDTRVMPPTEPLYCTAALDTYQPGAGATPAPAPG